MASRDVTCEERKVDKALKDTFPASDTPSVGGPTSTETPRSRQDRKAPIIRKEDIEAARNGEGHKQR
ncbi:MAG: hypothetical protein NW223_03780 [Hyphomicrobiaceae bacterium]|nr:hypothetical protein [Hyphomicrobiaceae bacterium]